MALPISGPLAFSEIGGILSSTPPFALSYMAGLANLPQVNVKVSDFYGYSAGQSQAFQNGFYYSDGTIAILYALGSSTPLFTFDNSNIDTIINVSINPTGQYVIDYTQGSYSFFHLFITNSCGYQYNEYTSGIYTVAGADLICPTPTGFGMGW